MAKALDPASMGRKGGRARAKKLSEKELSEQGRAAVQERWRRYREAKAAESGDPVPNPPAAKRKKSAKK